MKTATSIQYMKHPEGYTLEELCHIYFNWLPTLFHGPLKVRKGDALSLVEITLFGISLLELKKTPSQNQISFSVVGGLLSKKSGTFSFYENNGQLVTALCDFSPRLPWPIYRITQYPFHDLVMFLYSQHLISLKKD